MNFTLHNPSLLHYTMLQKPESVVMSERAFSRCPPSSLRPGGLVTKNQGIPKADSRVWLH